MNQVFEALFNIGIVNRTENPDEGFTERFDLRLEADNAFFSLEDLERLKILFKPDKLSINFAYDHDNKENACWLEFWFK